MSKQEKASWSLLLINLLIGAWYFSTLFELGTDVVAQLPVTIELFIQLTIVSIVLAIAGEIVMYLLEGETKDKVERDERDHLISLKARRNGYFVLVGSVLLLMVLLVTAIGITQREPSLPGNVVTFLQHIGQSVFMANLLLLALMLTEVAIQGSRVFYYRRG